MAQLTFVHGIMNKPSEDAELEYWIKGLSSGPDGISLSDLEVSVSSVYWADVLYESPLEFASAAEAASASELVMIEKTKASAGVKMADRRQEEQKWTFELAAKLGGSATLISDEGDTPPESEADGSFERVPLPWFIKEKFLKSFLRDVHHYLFNEEVTPRQGETYKVQDEIRRRFIEKVRNSNGRPHIVLSHSMGTVIAYDCLKRVAECPQVDLLITLGSPLGLDEIQDKLQPEWTRANGYPEKIRSKWVNIFDHLDPVAAFDPFLSSDFRKSGEQVVVDIYETNQGLWRHDLESYLRSQNLRRILTDFFGSF